MDLSNYHKEENEYDFRECGSSGLNDLEEQGSSVTSSSKLSSSSKSKIKKVNPFKFTLLYVPLA